MLNVEHLRAIVSLRMASRQGLTACCPEQHIIDWLAAVTTQMRPRIRRESHQPVPQR